MYGAHRKNLVMVISIILFSLTSSLNTLGYTPWRRNQMHILYSLNSKNWWKTTFKNPSFRSSPTMGGVSKTNFSVQFVWKLPFHHTTSHAWTQWQSRKAPSTCCWNGTFLTPFWIPSISLLVLCFPSCYLFNKSSPHLSFKLPHSVPNAFQ